MFENALMLYGFASIFITILYDQKNLEKIITKRSVVNVLWNIDFYMWKIKFSQKNGNFTVF